jgi:hypothetical protein
MRALDGEEVKGVEDKADTKEPTFRAKAFVCPNCQIYAHQRWWLTYAYSRDGRYQYTKGDIDNLAASYCEACGRYCLWVASTLVYPLASTAPMPVEDTPEDVRADFLEARSVFDRSPKSAAALLRLALQKLMVHLGEKGADLNSDIASLVRKGLSAGVQQALDTVRVVGNNAVHPGTIDLNDKKETAGALFGLVNFIVDQMITQPKKLDQMFKSLPQSSRAAIEKRDGKK